MSTSAAPQPTPPSASGGSSSAPSKNKQPAETPNQKSIFLSLALNMTWRLAVAVLVPVLIGVRLDKSFGTKNLWTFVGLALALIGSGVVMWRAKQEADRLPVPKLTDEQKRQIKKQYEEDDNE